MWGPRQCSVSHAMLIAVGCCTPTRLQLPGKQQKALYACEAVAVQQAGSSQQQRPLHDTELRRHHIALQSSGRPVLVPLPTWPAVYYGMAAAGMSVAGSSPMHPGVQITGSP